MEQRLRLVGGSRYEKRAEDRHPIAVAGQIVWKDAKGNTRMASVVTRDVSAHGVSVDCQGGTPIPLYRLVYFQVDRAARDRAVSALDLHRDRHRSPHRRGRSPSDLRDRRVRHPDRTGADLDARPIQPSGNLLDIARVCSLDSLQAPPERAFAW